MVLLHGSLLIYGLVDALIMKTTLLTIQSAHQNTQIPISPQFKTFTEAHAPNTLTNHMLKIDAIVRKRVSPVLLIHDGRLKAIGQVKGIRINTRYMIC